MGTVAEGKILPTLKDFGKMVITFALTVLAWIFFRADNLHHAILYISKIFSFSLFKIPSLPSKNIIVLIFIFFIIEWLGRENNYALEKLGIKWNKPLRYAFYYMLILLIFLFAGEEQQFIYFQF